MGAVHLISRRCRCHREDNGIWAHKVLVDYGWMCEVGYQILQVIQRYVTQAANLAQSLAVARLEAEKVAPRPAAGLG